jgi:hypothetical protein
VVIVLTAAEVEDCVNVHTRNSARLLRAVLDKVQARATTPVVPVERMLAEAVLEGDVGAVEGLFDHLKERPRPPAPPPPAAGVVTSQWILAAARARKLEKSAALAAKKAKARAQWADLLRVAEDLRAAVDGLVYGLKSRKRPGSGFHAVSDTDFLHRQLDSPPPEAYMHRVLVRMGPTAEQSEVALSLGVDPELRLWGNIYGSEKDKFVPLPDIQAALLYVGTELVDLVEVPEE